MGKEWGRGERECPDGRRTEVSSHVAASDDISDSLDYGGDLSRREYMLRCSMQDHDRAATARAVRAGRWSGLANTAA
eukprot:scaffold14319_cov154-Isochrysis_galbana.AAC.1